MMIPDAKTHLQIKNEKRRIRQTAWDNWYGYIGTCCVIAFVNTPFESMEQQANTNLPKWILSATIHQYEDRSFLSVTTIHSNRSEGICLDTFSKAKAYFSREYATPGFRAKWEIKS